MINVLTPINFAVQRHREGGVVTVFAVGNPDEPRKKIAPYFLKPFLLSLCILM